jgi:hypothetical protein
MYNTHLIRTHADSPEEAFAIVRDDLTGELESLKRYHSVIEGTIDPFGYLWFPPEKDATWSPGMREKGKALHYLKERLWEELQWTSENTNSLAEYMEFFTGNHTSKPLKPMLDVHGFTELEDLVAKLKDISLCSKEHFGVFSEEDWDKVHQKVSQKFSIWDHTFRPFKFNKMGLTEICVEPEDRFDESKTPYLVVLSVETK